MSSALEYVYVGSHVGVRRGDVLVRWSQSLLVEETIAIKGEEYGAAHAVEMPPEIGALAYLEEQVRERIAITRREFQALAARNRRLVTAIDLVSISLNKVLRQERTDLPTDFLNFKMWSVIPYQSERLSVFPVIEASGATFIIRPQMPRTIESRMFAETGSVYDAQDTGVLQLNVYPDGSGYCPPCQDDPKALVLRGDNIELLHLAACRLMWIRDSRAT